MSRAPIARGEFVTVASPFAHLDAEEVEKVREAMRDASRVSFDAAIGDLETSWRAHRPSVCGDLSFRFWMHQDGIASGGEHALEQHHVEYAQELVLRGPLNESEPDAYVASAVQAAIEALRRVGGASSMRRWPDGDLDEVGKARFEATESIRRFHQDVRGDFNPEQF